MGPERRLETKCCKLVRASGGLSIKLDPRWAAGIPDRLYLLPNGVCWFVEFKSPRGKCTPLQLAWAARIKERNGVYLCTSDYAEFTRVLSFLLSAEDPA